MTVAQLPIPPGVTIRQIGDPRPDHNRPRNVLERAAMCDDRAEAIQIISAALGLHNDRLAMANLSEPYRWRRFDPSSRDAGRCNSAPQSRRCRRLPVLHAQLRQSLPAHEVQASVLARGGRRMTEADIKGLVERARSIADDEGCIDRGCIIALADALESLSRSGAVPAGWRPMESAPKDGTPVVGAELHRFMRYKPAGRRQMKAEGRWQRWNGYGWDNSEPPEAWMPAADLAAPPAPPSGGDAP